LPLSALPSFPTRRSSDLHVAAVTDDRHVDADVLVDRRGVYIDMDLLGVRRERIDAAGDAVVEARADAQHDVAIMHRHIGLVGARSEEHTSELQSRSDLVC